MKMRLKLCRAAIRSNGIVNAFEITPEYYESFQDACEVYPGRTLGLVEENAMTVEIGDGTKIKKTRDEGFEIPQTAYIGEDD